MPDYGGLAQLGERLHGMQEVRGSIPLLSTTNTAQRVFWAVFFCVPGMGNDQVVRVHYALGSRKRSPKARVSIGRWNLKANKRLAAAGYFSILNYYESLHLCG